MGAALALAGENPATRPELTQVHNVYLMSMGNGLDQYLTNYITRNQVYQVVTDPAMADAIFTDQIDKDFDGRLAELLKKKEPPVVAKEEPKPKEKGEPKTLKQAAEDARTSQVRYEESFIRTSTFSRGKGNIFMVDPKTHRVIWSYHDRPTDSSPRRMDDVAEDIVKRLAKDIKGK
jgi:hypothetical protein